MLHFIVSCWSCRVAMRASRTVLSVSVICTRKSGRMMSISMYANEQRNMYVFIRCRIYTRCLDGTSLTKLFSFGGRVLLVFGRVRVMNELPMSLGEEPNNKKKNNALRIKVSYIYCQILCQPVLCTLQQHQSNYSFGYGCVSSWRDYHPKMRVVLFGVETHV